MLALTSLVPVFSISIRWASYFGDTSKLGIALATFMFHLVHGLFLVACIWVALDPPFSPCNRGFGSSFPYVLLPRRSEHGLLQRVFPARVWRKVDRRRECRLTCA